jgi:hypothetical protein
MGSTENKKQVTSYKLQLAKHINTTPRMWYTILQNKEICRIPNEHDHQ